MREDECKRLNIEINPLDAKDINIPTQADGDSPLQIVGKAKFQANRGKIDLHFEGYVCRRLQSAILCGGPFMEENKIVQELSNKRIVIDNKYYVMETSPMCPDPLPELVVSHSKLESKDKGDGNVNEIDAIKNDSMETLHKIEIGPQVPKKVKEKLIAIHRSHDTVFDGDISKGYNGYSGDHLVDFNFINDIPPPVQQGCVPSYTSRQDLVLMQAKIDQLENMGVVAKANDIGIIPKFASPTLLVQKHSVRDMGKDVYNALPIEEKIKHNRLVLCQNKLNEFVEKIPHMYTTVEDTIKAVGEKEFVITTDLTDSFWQRHITENKKPFFAFHSPFRGNYIFLRSSQGFLNQSEGLENLVRCVLQEGIAEGWVIVHADNIYVTGDEMEITVNRWKFVLDKLAKNNLKLSAKKTACFPTTLDLLGWTKCGRFLIPDKHRQNALSKADLPKTAHDLRSYIGGYRRFFKSQKDMSQNLQELEEFVAKTETKFEKLEWNEVLKAKFESSKEKIKTLDQLYIPKTEDQLVLTSDWSKKGISATLWASVDDKFHVVARTSCKLSPSQEKMIPCEGECAAHFVGAKCTNFRSYIKASKLKTIALTDSKPVYQAANLLKKGKFSTSKLINELLTSISDLGLEYQHLSGKMGQNFMDDYGSRNPVDCSNKSECKICSFLKDCEELTVGPVLSFTTTNVSIISSVDIKEPRETNRLVWDIIRGAATVPFNNRQAMKFLQDQDPDLLKLRFYLTSGKRPQDKNTRETTVKKYLQRNNNITIAKDGCIVVTKQSRKFIRSELVVIPEHLSMGILYGMHINLNHPTHWQLSRVIDTKFFILEKDKKIRQLVKQCTLCQSVAKIPKEIHEFEPNQIPDHPGKEFTVDVLRFGGKCIVVAIENFSGWVSTQIISSESGDHLLEGIIQTVTPYKASNLALIRVDQAPGFRKIFRQKSDLSDLGIDIQLGEAKNKNALALVDRKMKELEEEIKKLAPANNVIGLRILARATSLVNEKEVNKGKKCLSAKEILFSRDQYTGENLTIKDEEMVMETMENRKRNNEYSANSKATVQKKATPAGAKEGQIVFLKEDGNKLERRDMYLVTKTNDPDNSLTICKLAHSLSNRPGSLQPQNFSYKVKQTDVYLAPNQPIQVNYEYLEEPHADEDYDAPEPRRVFPVGPDHRYTKEPAQHTFQVFQNVYEEDSEDEDETEETEKVTRIIADPNIEEDHQDAHGDSSEPASEHIEEENVMEMNEDRGVPNDMEENEQDWNLRNRDSTSENSIETAREEIDIDSLGAGYEGDDNGENDSEEDDYSEAHGENNVNVDDEDNLEEFPADPPIDQHRKPRKGDTIQVVIDGYWRTVRISSNEHKSWKNYYNFILEDGSEDGMYLHRESLYWTFTLINNIPTDNVEQDPIERGYSEEEEGRILHDTVVSTPGNPNNNLKEEIREDGVAEYLDDSYSDQESICGSSNVMHLTNSLNSSLQRGRLEAFESQVKSAIDADQGRAFHLVQELNLELPRSGYLVPNRVYVIPPHWRHESPVTRSRIISASLTELEEVSGPEQTRLSAWERRLNRLRNFLSRIAKPLARRR